MEIEHLSLHRLGRERAAYDAVVVVDVLRSFTTAACAFAGGARAIYPVDGASEAFAFWRRRPHALLVGAQPGGRPVPGFDLPNSPAAAAARSDLGGRDLILSTAAGVRGLLRYSEAPAVFAAALVNAGATAEALRALAPTRVALLVTGEWVDRDGDEDRACADLIEAHLRGVRIDSAYFEARVLQSDFGRRFGGADADFLPAADLALCARADTFGFAMTAGRDPAAGGRLVLRPAF
jgi:2-phosphosulfolactate phosphatase